RSALRSVAPVVRPPPKRRRTPLRRVGQETSSGAPDRVRAARPIEPRSVSLCVPLESAEIEQHARLVADGPGVVTWRHVERVAWSKLQLGSVVHLERHAPLQHVTDVVHLAGVRAGDRPDVLRPAPPRLKRSAAYCVAV